MRALDSVLCQGVGIAYLVLVEDPGVELLVTPLVTLLLLDLCMQNRHVSNVSPAGLTEI